MVNRTCTSHIVSVHVRACHQTTVACGAQAHNTVARSCTHGDPVDIPFKSYGDPDVGNRLPGFTPPQHFHEKGCEFLLLFFTVDMIKDI